MQKVQVLYGGKKPLVLFLYWDEIEDFVFEGVHIQLVN